VISVIALLLALLMPALRGARNQARKVMCRSNLRQFGSVLLMYVDDNEGRLPWGDGSAIWLLRGSSPWEQQDQDAPDVSQSVRMARAILCPMAVKPANYPATNLGRVADHGNTMWRLEGSSGSTFRAWTITSPGPAFHGSYGFNVWPFAGLPGNSGGFFHGHGGLSRRLGLNVCTVASKSSVPILLDSMHSRSWFRSGNMPPPVDTGGLSFCINRHNGRVNGLFLDWSVREVGLKELWTLKWCPNFDTSGPWTRAGGVQPEDWPEWMRGFKDY
jgi:prepilin-type processing-associated H-X9-DG protein